ncbi:hypothetical protein MPTK1_3g14650 [Marchantia polymorpha subsp. ruderalis]|uniref:Uncharacterized protein n=2 Tax=Marchantia polymorpha TaxID=3197 RepID=A0AAF6B0U2_MARPO|nr:hypothetical protein MARPO_0004s0206 [Marchantia polymorpha]BBN05626.1 hypothetical protein Mp_3g14650 [Marchantia polymorpha subsp. ruderalis]|eukprot:PTQ48956.1 hypothetical protein MARPO_0004s0206 [Marchantia polymorpha]
MPQVKCTEFHHHGILQSIPHKFGRQLPAVESYCRSSVGRQGSKYVILCPPSLTRSFGPVPSLNYADGRQSRRYCILLNPGPSLRRSRSRRTTTRSTCQTFAIVPECIQHFLPSLPFVHTLFSMGYSCSNQFAKGRRPDGHIGLLSTFKGSELFVLSYCFLRCDVCHGCMI